MRRAQDRRTVLIMAGGTGGHVFPALAVAEELTARGVSVSWLGTRRGLEARVVPAAGYPLETLRVSGLRGKGVWRLLLAPFMLLVALLQALRIELRLRPRAVLGMGGFTAGPGGVIAWLLRRPLLIHEQNSIAGLTNRWLAPLARTVMEAFPGSLPGRYQPVHTGNPVRAGITRLHEPAQRLAGRGGAMRVLVIGGSLGASALNAALPAAIAAMPAARLPEVYHQTGRGDRQAVQAAYRAAGVAARVEAFIEDMAAAYAWADVVVCRSGALTVAELAVVGVASVLVPFPHATDDHQTGNARYLADAGAAVLLPQATLTPEKLAGLLTDFSSRRALLLEMAGRARALARPDAAHRVATLCLQAAGVADGAADKEAGI
ncbi:MAG: undecaprenyldiphospho-muramoylpentapeptide beta-N-acetylglucosaminyltransferase [Gammaproteobacteria bacterium]|jgi:UDP-N-acetylglucosamine--N-acetylmuramyl-(pentapeptide) pyrophosphoryl-undecaprenol N-acetylglucosamine transferase